MSYAETTLYLLLFTTGIMVSFGHCIGMCGPIVVSISLNLKGRSLLVPHLLYNAGRITTYAILGGLMGITGSSTRIMTNMAGLQKGVVIFAGLLIILMGMAMGGCLRFGSIFDGYDSWSGMISKGFNRLSRSRLPVTYYPLGLVLGLLPCGPVYTAAMTAALVGMDSAGSLEGFLRGAGLMLAFGMGTVPALLLVAKLTDLGGIRKRAMTYKIGSLLMVMVGAYYVIKGITI